MQHPTNNTFVPTLPDHRPQAIHNFFLPYQLRFIDDPSRKRIVRKSRQIGVSHNAAYDLLHEASRAANPSDARLSSREGRHVSPLPGPVSRWRGVGLPRPNAREPRPSQHPWALAAGGTSADSNRSLLRAPADLVLEST